jgi:hypothetical protein
MARPTETRLGPARHRASLAKVALAAGGACVFLAASALAKVAYPGHVKRHARPLSAPRRFVEMVRQNQLQAGILAPAQAPPEVTSAPS